MRKVVGPKGTREQTFARPALISRFDPRPTFTRLRLNVAVYPETTIPHPSAIPLQHPAIYSLSPVKSWQTPAIPLSQTSGLNAQPGRHGRAFRYAPHFGQSTTGFRVLPP